MYLSSKISFNYKHYFSYILAAIPLSFIAGNMIINFNIVVLIFSALLFFKSDLFKIKFFFLDKLIFFYFFLILSTAAINDFHFFTEKMEWKGYFSTIKKSIFFLRYLFIYLVLRFLIEKDYVNLKYFFISSSFAVLFVSFDVLFQFFNGKDLFGYVGKGRKFGGPFGDELIAGSFIQRFSLFAFFVIPIFFKQNKLKKYYIIIFPTLFILLLSGTIISGNRIPTLIFIFIIFLLLFFLKQTRRLLLPFLIVLTLVFSVLFKTSDAIKVNFLDLRSKSFKILEYSLNKDFYNKDAPMHLKEFATFYDTWLINKYLGGGIKNFRYYCHERENIDKNSDFICNMHPHNYYLEIVTETGLVGFFTMIIILTNILYISFIKKYFFKSSLNSNVLIVPFIFLLIGEIFPLKSTGSFFTTGNATYIFLIIGIIVAIIKKNVNI